MIKALLGLLLAGVVMIGGVLVTQNTQPIQPDQPNQPNFGSFGPTGGSTYRLGQSVGTTDTTIKLSSFKEPVSNIPYTMAYLNSDIIYGTLSPQSSFSEFISASGITQNSDGSATLTGVVRGLSRTPAGSNCVASTTLAQAHAGQSIFIISNSPCFYSEYTPLRTAATSSAVLVFSSTSPPRLDQPGAQASGSYISTTSEFATFALVAAVGNAGTVNATAAVKGIVQLATGLQQASSTLTGSTGASLALITSNATDTPQSGCAAGFTSTAGAGCSVIAQLTGKIRQAFINLTEAYTWTGTHIFNGLTTFNATSTIATSTVLGKTFGGNVTTIMTAGQALTGLAIPQPVSLATTTANVFITDGDVASTTNFIGFAVNSVAANSNAYVQTEGVVGGFSALTAGSRYYVSDTAGTLSTTVGTFEVYVGTAISTTQILIDHGTTAATQYVGSSAISVSSGTTGYSQPAFARSAIVAFAVTNSDKTFGDSGNMPISKIGQTGLSINSQGSTAGRGCVYTLTWTGTAVTVTETTETTATCSIAGTIYWYR